MSRVVNYVNLANQWAEEEGDLLPLIQEFMSGGHYVLGDVVSEFEQNIADYCGCDYAVALNSGTDALVCSLHAIGVRPGDEVITPPNSFVASTAAIVHLGARPVFVDVSEDQMLDPSLIEAAITKKTKAIMPVHLTGRMAKMDQIIEIANQYGLDVIEDSAQSIGSAFKGKKSGAYGRVGCFSTHPLKNLNACGDGGFIVTNDLDIANKIKSMRNHGLIDRNVVEEFGFVSRLDSLQAVILNYRLSKLSSVIERRRQNAKAYLRALNQDHIFFPNEDHDYFDTHHTFVVQIDKRDEAMNHLLGKGINTAIHYPIPIHLQPAAKNLGYGSGDFPIAEEQARRIVSLPINQYLKSDEIDFVATTLNDFLN